MTDRRTERGCPVLLDALTILDMILLAAWIILCALKIALPDSVILAITGGLCLLSLGLCIWALLIPDLPRLPGEQGCAKEHSSRWVGLAILLIFFGFWGYDSGQYLSHRHPLFEDRYTAAFVTSLFVLPGLCLTAGLSRRMVCWNAECILIRTCLGQVHRIGWEEITARGGAKGCDYVYVGTQRYALPKLPIFTACDFWQQGTLRRKELGLAPVPWKEKGHSSQGG